MTPKHLKNLKDRGMIKGFEIVKKEKKACKYKAFIQAALEDYCKEKKTLLWLEHYFAKPRMWRFDWAMKVGNKLVSIEYEGIYGGKSRHTTVGGYAKDLEKYNHAALDGWIVLRYCASNHKDILTDLDKL
jgi:hypothetical protein